MIICRGTNEINAQIFTPIIRDKLSLQGARIDRNYWACAIFRSIPNLQACTDGRTDRQTDEQRDELIRVELVIVTYRRDQGIRNTGG